MTSPIPYLDPDFGPRCGNHLGEATRSRVPGLELLPRIPFVTDPRSLELKRDVGRRKTWSRTHDAQVCGAGECLGQGPERRRPRPPAARRCDPVPWYLRGR